MTITPTLPDFAKLAAGHKLVALTTEITMDLDTPVSVYYKLVGDGEGYILESVDTSHQQFGRYSFIGAEPFARVQVFKSRLMIRENDLMRCLEGEPVATLKRYLSTFRPALPNPELPLTAGGLIGYFNYEIVGTFDRVRGLELGDEELLGQFMVCRVMVVFDALKNVARLVYFADTTKDTPENVYRRAIIKLVELQTRLSKPIPESLLLPNKPREDKINFRARYATPPDGVLDGIRDIKEHILAGDIFQAVPSFRFSAEVAQPGFLFYRRLRQVNPSPYMYYLNFGAVKLIGASPERLVKVEGGRVYTYPIAGTRKRGASEAEDAALAADLVADEKECAEHSMLVDLARNDIGRISEPGTVQVTKLREVEKFSHVMHMVSEVVGTLRREYTPLDVLRAVFPAGTVSGAPKLRAIEIVNALETVRRDSYAGALGYLDFAGNMDVCITLRTMRLEDDERAYIQCGAGIVADSVPENEYREFLQKAQALFTVVEDVENA